MNGDPHWVSLQDQRRGELGIRFADALRDLDRDADFVTFHRELRDIAARAARFQNRIDKARR